MLAGTAFTRKSRNDAGVLRTGVGPRDRLKGGALLPVVVAKADENHVRVPSLKGMLTREGRNVKRVALRVEFLWGGSRG